MNVMKPNMYHVTVCVYAYLSTYPRRTPLSCGSGGGCHWTMMDWFVRPLATIFFGGALGASSLSINLTDTHKEKKTEQKQERQMIMLYFISRPVMTISVMPMSRCSICPFHLVSNISINMDGFMCTSSI